MNYKFVCPHCSAKMSGTEKHINLMVTCPKCKNKFQAIAETAPEETLVPEPSKKVDIASSIVVTTQRTGKLWKSIQLLSVLVVVACAVVFFASFGQANRAVPSIVPVLSLLIGLLGLVAFFVGRVGAWWNHG